ncbi:MAG: HAMP domain-containing histidine kinase [Lachnospiraceae bacterium]|nr:HAMP domain-containing histidine kinase [Lachnospiraceae bacterium]
MKGKLISVTIVFSLAIILLSLGCYFSSKSLRSEDEKSEYIVALNEIKQLNNKQEYEKAQEKISNLQTYMYDAEEQKSGAGSIMLLCSVSVLFFLVAFGYIYFAILRPFEKMKEFAVEISAGNFDIPLQYQRTNYFGEFTWSFDNMRNEIVKLRANEKEAVENNKTIIATLSHDIKTPISSIRAYIEGLSANMDNSYEKRERYLRVITKKCDEVSRLTDDLFLHSISDLDKLKITPEKIKICSFMENVIREIAAEQNDVCIRKTDLAVFVKVDKNRLTQIAENLINNARKYAKTDVDVFFTKEDSDIVLHFRDYGSGIPDENMPFIFDKFYRGNNCGSEPGSGLGLYIVKYITEKMDGTVTLNNHKNGLEVMVSFPVCCGGIEKDG